MQKKYDFYTTGENKNIYLNTTFDVKVRIPALKTKSYQLQILFQHSWFGSVL